MSRHNPYLRQLDNLAADLVGKDRTTLAQIILDEINTASQSRRANKSWKVNSAIDRQRAAQRRLAIDFGADRWWRLSDADFGIGALGRGGVSGGEEWWALPRPFFDHSYFYRVGRRAAAIATHPYDLNEAECRAFAAANNLTLERPPDWPSWWYPGHTIFVVYVGPAGRQASAAVQWQPPTSPRRTHRAA